jgi:protein TonB
VLHSPEPKYPKGKKKEGSVFMCVIVDETGKVDDIRVFRGLGPDYDENAASAVRTWDFEPASADGKPVSVQIMIEVNFRR